MPLRIAAVRAHTVRWSLDGPTGNIVNNPGFINSDANAGFGVQNLPAGDYQVRVDATTLPLDDLGNPVVQTQLARPNADFGSSYYGGKKEEWDALNSYPRNVVDGTAADWVTAHSIANAGVADQAGYDALSQYVDIPNLINYMLVNFYGGSANVHSGDHLENSHRTRFV